MKRSVHLLVISLALLAAACSDAETTASTGAPTTSSSTTSTAAPTTTTPPSTSTSSTEATTTTSTTMPPTGFQEIGACKLLAGTDDATGLGYAQSPDRLPSTGPVELVMLFTDFSDVAANRTPEDVFSILSPGAEQFFADQSYGRMQLSIRPHFEWLRLDGPASEYSDAIRTFDGHRAFIQEAVDLADDAVDFAGADEVIVIATPNASEVAYGPTWMGGSFPDGQLTPDGTSITNGITSGADLLFWEDLWLPHEMGHSLGLPDLYSYSGPDGFTRPFSIMDLINSEAPGFMAYSRWILGWLDDDQIGCIDRDSEATLTPIETEGGLKALMVPIDRETALVVESRRAIGYDSELSREGAVVYVVDTGIWSGEGPIVVLNDARALVAGESISYEHVTVTVADATTEGDTISIELAAG